VPFGVIYSCHSTNHELTLFFANFEVGRLYICSVPKINLVRDASDDHPFCVCAAGKHSNSVGLLFCVLASLKMTSSM
jgi:hypothetical protein